MITIGIPFRNTPEFLKMCLSSILENTPGRYQVLIVDDDSNQESKEYLKTIESAGIKIIHNIQQEGFPYNCNLIIDNAETNKICFLNSDTFVYPNWISPMNQAIIDSWGVVGCMTNRGQNRQVCRSLEYRPENRVEPIDSVYGFCFMTTKEVIKNVGYFDERFGLGSFEEADFCFRARKLHYPVGFCRNSYVHHHGKGSFGQDKWVGDLWKQNEQIYWKKVKGEITGEIIKEKPKNVRSE